MFIKALGPGHNVLIPKSIGIWRSVGWFSSPGESQRVSPRKWISTGCARAIQARHSGSRAQYVQVVRRQPQFLFLGRKIQPWTRKTDPARANSFTTSSTHKRPPRDGLVHHVHSEATTLEAAKWRLAWVIFVSRRRCSPAQPPRSTELCLSQALARKSPFFVGPKLMRVGRLASR